MQPTNRTCYRDSAYFGYEGMINMLEIVANDWEAALRSKEIRWEQYQ
jgi:nitrogenase molybdenum-iron protein alpha/beta subunit